MNRLNLKGNWPLLVGAVGSFIYFGVGHFVALSDALRFFILGLSMAGYLLGAFIARFGYARIHRWKNSVLQRLK